MAKKKADLKNELHSFLYISFAVFILLLSLFNLQSKREKIQVVLGATTDNTYWEELVNNHPTYRDAWIELGRMDKVYEIDPNYKE